MKAKCTNCKYEWESNSKLLKVSCPSCGNKVKIRELNDADEKKGEVSDEN